MSKVALDSLIQSAHLKHIAIRMSKTAVTPVFCVNHNTRVVASELTTALTWYR